jgi:hypothetical protein
MSDELQRVIVGLLSTIPLVAIFVALTYRAGEFTLLPGEPGKILAGFVIGYAIVVGFFVLLAVLPPTLDFVLVLVAAVATIGSLPIVQRRQEEFVRDQPPEQRAELERRGAFFRTGRGRAVVVAFGIVLIVWATTLGVLFR